MWRGSGSVLEQDPTESACLQQTRTREGDDMEEQSTSKNLCHFSKRYVSTNRKFNPKFSHSLVTCSCSVFFRDL